jgi:hypothetical protein
LAIAEQPKGGTDAALPVRPRMIDGIVMRAQWSFATREKQMPNAPRYMLLGFAFALSLTSSAWATGIKANRDAIANLAGRSVEQQTAAGVLNPPGPSLIEAPTYNYDEPNSCSGCHFTLGLDHTSRALGVVWNDTTQTWQLSGAGWLASRHAQSNYGATQNTFCAKCHSPLQAWNQSSFNNGNISAQPIPAGEFGAVDCTTCHAPDPVVTILSTQNPSASYGAAITVYLWKGASNPASYQTLVPGGEDVLCLNCHEERHSQDSAAFASMYAAGVRCIDCHMAPYQYFGPSFGLPQIAEREHDFKVAANVPFSCGAQGSLSGFGCHTEFTPAAAQQFIPYLMQQHSEWWQLPPFTGNTAPQVVVSAHAIVTPGDYRRLWQEIQLVQADQ